jgi:hypothetical protein
MKTALYMNDERVQVVLTPENDYERNIVKALSDQAYDLHVYKGQFTDVQGGWTMLDRYGYRGEERQSAIIVLDKKAEDATPHEDQTPAQ